jgi:isochorismate synthase
VAVREAAADPNPSRDPAFFFAGPSKTLLALDSGEPILGIARERRQLLRDVERVLEQRGEGTGMLVGAVPFSDDAPVRLFCPYQVTQSGTWGVPEDGSSPSRSGALEAGALVRPLDAGQAHFVAAVADATRAIREGSLEKVVLSRVQTVPLTKPPALVPLLRLLRARNPYGFTFALALDAGTRGEARTTLVGASPELLLSRRGSRVVSAPLAGSIPRATDPEEDRSRAERLLHSSKDRHEHELVVARIVETLAPLTRDLAFEREPVVTATHSMWHLSTRIEGRLQTPVSSLELALLLHPTPAVCGTPTAAARAFIARVEGLDRGYFTGTLGHMDASGDGDWIVTIRCAELRGDRARVFAGAGVVRSSVPLLELAETEAKMQTMLGAFRATEEL